VEIFHIDLFYEGSMRAADEKQSPMLSYVTRRHRWTRILRSCPPGPAFPSIAPERLLRALLVMVLYSARSERQLV
jgi:transposase